MSQLIKDFAKQLLEKKTLLERDIYNRNILNASAKEQIEEIDKTISDLNIEFETKYKDGIYERIEIKFKDQ